jgi:glycine/serine hydroxymethyltransferase
MAQIADFIDEAVSNHDNPQKLEQIAAKVKTFLSAFPLYKGAF